jgi:hypothetical protein
VASELTFSDDGDTIWRGASTDFNAVCFGVLHPKQQSKPAKIAILEVAIVELQPTARILELV